MPRAAPAPRSALGIALGSRVPSVSPSPWAPARGASAGAKQEAGTGSSWPYKAILALSMQLPAAPHPKAGSGAGSQRLACLLPVNLFPAEGPPEGRAGLGWPRPGPACEGTTACTGRDGRGVPHAQLGWLRSLGGCSGACSPSPTLLEEKKDRRCRRRTEDAENISTMLGTKARSQVFMGQTKGTSIARCRHTSSQSRHLTALQTPSSFSLLLSLRHGHMARANSILRAKCPPPFGAGGGR